MCLIVVNAEYRLTGLTRGLGLKPCLLPTLIPVFHSRPGVIHTRKGTITLICIPIFWNTPTCTVWSDLISSEKGIVDISIGIVAIIILKEKPEVHKMWFLFKITQENVELESGWE